MMNVQDLDNAEAAGEAAWIEFELDFDIEWNAPYLKRMARMAAGTAPPEVLEFLSPEEKAQADRVLGGE
jgi:hypothetical protein